MNKQQIQTKIKNLKQEDKILRERCDEIKAKYSRPSQWFSDPDFKAVNLARTAIDGEIDGLSSTLGEIDDQEWTDRMAVSYPDGQV